MKNEYKQYGKETWAIESTLSPQNKEILEAFLSDCAVTAGAGKLNIYRRYMLQFCDIVEKPLDKLTRQEAVKFWALIKTAQFEESTKITIRKLIRRFLKWKYQDMKMIEGLKGGEYKVNEQKLNTSKLLSPSEIEAIIRAAESLRDKALFALLYETGCRPSELREAKWESLNLGMKEITLYATKTKKARCLPLNESIIHLQRWKNEFSFPDLKPSDFIFPNPNRQRLSDSYVSNKIKRLAEKAGITKNVFPYLLRHTRLTEVHNKGIEGLNHNIFAGHSAGSKQTKTYVHLDEAKFKENVLSKVYHQEEISPEQKNKIESLENQVKELQKCVKLMFNQMQKDKLKEYDIESKDIFEV